MPLSGQPRRNSANASECGSLPARSELWRRPSVRRHSTARSSMVELEPADAAAAHDPMDALGPKPSGLEADADGVPYVFTGMRVRVRKRYVYLDSATYCVGHGAFGDVFKGYAYDRNGKNPIPVAIKRMARVNVKQNELEAMKRLRNPFLVRLIDICHENDDMNSYLIMELCHTDLEQYLQEQPNARISNLDEFESVMRDLSRGYYALYTESIVHRDIKPPNVLLVLSRDTNAIKAAKLTDFGVCRMLEEGDEGLTNVAGTFHYMAPEVGANVLTYTEYGHAVDMWSIGCVMYRCLTGELPFDEAQMCRLFLYCACNNYDAYDPPDLPEGTSDTHRDLIHGLLDIDRERRLSPAGFYAKMCGVLPIKEEYVEEMRRISIENGSAFNNCAPLSDRPVGKAAPPPVNVGVH